MIGDIVVLATLLIFAYMGYKKGFLKSMSKIFSIVISIAVAKFINPYVSNFIDNTFIGDKIREKVGESISTDAPVFIKYFSEYTADSVTKAIVIVVSLVVVFIATYLIAHFIIGALGLVAKIPGISFLNRMLGLISGVIMGLFIIYTLLAIVAVTDFHEFDKWIESSMVVSYMSEENLLLKLIL